MKRRVNPELLQAADALISVARYTDKLQPDYEVWVDKAEKRLIDVAFRYGEYVDSVKLVDFFYPETIEREAD